MKVLCIDIGGTNIKYALFQNGTHGEIKSINTPAGLNTNDMKKAIFPLIDEALSEVSSLDYVSISNCAQMRDNKVVFTSSKPGYIGCDWSELIKEEYDIDCIANNDLHCAVMGEYYYGIPNSEDRPKNFICMSIGTGINIGTIINGSLFTGDDNLSCYLDNVTDLDGEGQFKLASTASLLRLYKENSGQTIDGRGFIELLKKKDAIALTTYDTWTYRVARIIRNVSYMYNINTLSMCGGILNSDYPIIEDIKKKLREVTAKPYYENLHIIKSTLSSSQLYGAYAFVVNSATNLYYI